MVTGLSSLTGLNELILEFEYLQSFPDREIRHPLTRPILPALTHICFEGAIEYLEDLVARTDAPLLSDLTIFSFNQYVFHAPQFVQFHSRTSRLKAHNEAHVTFNSQFARIALPPQPFCRGNLCVRISYAESDQQLSFLRHVSTLFLSSVSTLENLYIYGDSRGHSLLDWNVENTRWFELLRLFSNVKNLHVSKEFTKHFAHALQRLVVGGATQGLPKLQELFLESPQQSGAVWEDIEQFIAVRQLSGCHVVLSRWERNYRSD